jgi:hypothetical protein
LFGLKEVKILPKIGKSTTKQKQKTIRNNEKIYCRKCQDYKSNSYFYEATNPMLDCNGFMSICKDCCHQIYDDYFSIYNNLEKSLYLTCRDLDICFNKDALKSAQTHIESLISKGKRAEKIFGYYKSKLGSTGKNNSGITDFRFKDTEKEDVEQIFVINSEAINNEEYESVEIEYLRIKWGMSLPVSDLMWLEQKHNEWYDNYDIQGKAMELLVQQLCFEELFVYKERQTGEDVSKRLKSIQDMLKNTKLSPRMETASEQAEFQTISEFIKKVEQTKPFIKVNPEFEDPDNFKKMWQSLAGAINRTAGKPDENTEVFEEYFKDSTMDLTNLSSKESE